MGLTVVLEDEDGQAIQLLPNEFDYRVLNEVDLNDFRLLKYIDFYGDTTFNRLQVPDLISDFERLKAIRTEQKPVIQRIINLARLGQGKIHSYLKFYGD